MSNMIIVFSIIWWATICFWISSKASNKKVDKTTYLFLKEKYNLKMAVIDKTISSGEIIKVKGWTFNYEGEVVSKTQFHEVLEYLTPGFELT